MAEAQAQAAGCLRLLSLSDLVKVDIMAAGAVRFLTPLLESKLHHARWNARQVLLDIETRLLYAGLHACIFWHVCLSDLCAAVYGCKM